MEKPTASSPEVRFHIDRRGRILVENMNPQLLELARRLAPSDPRLAAWSAAEASRRRRSPPVS